MTPSRLDAAERAKAIVQRLHADLNDRRGLHIDDIDDAGIIAEIVAAHERIVREGVAALLEENERMRAAAQGAHKLLSRHGLGESVENEEWRQATASLATALSERPADGR